MFKKTLFLLFISILFFPSKSKADEGMWLLQLLEKNNYKEMQRLGLKLKPEDIYSINHSSLKDAIIQFGRGCTGEIISSEGLILTNHHCGYASIQSHSSVENDYLKDGFWAQTLKDEIPNEGLTAKFLIRIEDVTEKIMKGLSDTMTEAQRSSKIKEISSTIEKEITSNSNYDASVSNFFDGNEFYLLVYEVYKDVRLVGAPPSSIGKFGADTDNWMWPRHTGDFSMFRVYMSPDGKPAEYSKDNIPYKPKHFLPISIKGAEKTDFTMTIGYPGRTSRYLSSYGINQAIELSNPSIVKIREKKLTIMKEGMDKSDTIRIQYAAKYAQTSNYWKYFIGQTRGLKRLKVIEKKQEIEKKFDAWAKSSPELQKKYGTVISDFEKSYKMLNAYILSRWYFVEAISRGGELIALSAKFEPLLKELKEKNPSQEAIKKISAPLQKSLPDFYKDYNLGTDKKIFAAMLEMFYKDVPKEQHPDIYKLIFKKYKGDFNKYTDYAYSKSFFVSKEKLEAYLANPTAKKLEADPVFALMKSFYNNYYKNLVVKMQEGNDLLSKSGRKYIAGLRAMNPDKIYAPDANSTMRLSYGQVLDYEAANAVHYNYYTTLDGVMEKEDPKNWEFVVPKKLKELYEKKDYGRYASKNGEMHVCFTSNNDITGGNSGSPVINGNGQLVGLAFDGNWEAMSGDIFYEPDIQRTISVDIRYVLFIVDKYAGAKRLLDEMSIVE